MHTTNYYNAFISVADDCPTKIAVIPPQKDGVKTVANIEYDMMTNAPYQYTSDEVLFHVFAVKNNISEKDLNAERRKFFAKGQPCLRSSPLAKRYGWGIHCDGDGKTALYAMESAEYQILLKDEKIKLTKAMRSKRG